MKKVVVLLIGIIIGILAVHFFVRSLGYHSRGNIANPFLKMTVEEYQGT